MSALVDVDPVAHPDGRLTNRAAVTAAAVGSFAMLAGVMLASVLVGRFGIEADFGARLVEPSWTHWFGTDQLGHDMFARTLHGLAISLRIGIIAASISVAIATLLALIATTCGRGGDAIVAFLIDVTMGLPHLVLLIVIAFALGGGANAVTIAVAVTHWPRLTRILRAEILQLRGADFVMASRRMGKSWAYVGRYHFLPHLVPQLLVGLALLLPHAILHEAGLTFIGFGLEPSRPAIGLLLADSMRYLMAGKWWLGLFPGLCLLGAVLCFDTLGNALRALTDPRQEQN